MKLDLKPLAIVVSTICIASCGSSGGSSSENSASITTPPLVTTPDNSGGAASSKGAFIEENGVVVVELESTDYSGNWQLKSETSASGGKAIEWVGDDLFNEPAVDIINVEIKITNPGTYRFDWATQIGEGNKTTEANDSWLKIESDNFYGFNGTTTVCPKGQVSSENSCVGELPEGSGKLGWFKTYRAGGDVAQFTWSTNTSDRDPHLIYADFNQAGIYSVKISGRSKHHVIDRFIMTNDPATHEAAKNYDESARENK